MFTEFIEFYEWDLKQLFIIDTGILFVINTDLNRERDNVFDAKRWQAYS